MPEPKIDVVTYYNGGLSWKQFMTGSKNAGQMQEYYGAFDFDEDIISFFNGRTPLQVADGVEYGNSFAANPHTAVLLRKLGAKEIPCPGLCPNVIPEEALPPEEPVR